ncbi:MAG TPA: MBG domain-containing protein, partial [Bacteroidales bacterium]|nr:MBG domain-containing protein [Bacteroidales bacterium]
NYTITYTNGDIIVTAAALTIDANDVTKSYGTAIAGGAGSAAFTATGLQNGETVGTVTIAYGTGAAATDAVGTYVNQVTPSLATGGTFNAANYTITYINGDIIVTGAALTIDANDVTKSYGTAITGGAGSAAFTATGLQNGETVGTVTIAYGTGATATDAAGTYANQVTPSLVTGGTFNAANYTITYTNGDIIVTAAALTIDANDVTKSYGTAIAGGAGSAAFTATGLQNGETVGTVTIVYGTGAAATDAAGTYANQVTPSLVTGGTFNAANYTITYTNGDIIVTQVPLSITASDLSKCEGTTLTFSGTEFTAAGLIGSDVVTSVTLNSAGAIAGAGIAGSPYAIVPSNATGSGLSNYTISYNNGSLTINPAPAASVSIVSDAVIICAGTMVNFTATAVNGGATPVYQWYNGTTPVGTNSSLYSSNSLSDNDKITVVMTSSLSCVSGSPSTSNEITMAVNPLLPVSVSITADNNPVCTGTTVNFTATPVNGGLTPAYQWMVNGTNAGINSSTFSYVPADNDVVNVVLTSSETCQSGGPATSNAVTMIVKNIVPVSVVIAPDINPICAGAAITFTATPANGGTTPSYQWFNGASPVGSNSNVYSYVPANGDVITAVLTSNRLCIIGNPATSNAVTVSVTNNLTASATPTPVLCNGASNGRIDVTIAGGTAPYVYRIDGGSFQPSATFSNVVAGTHTVTVQDASMCSTTISVTVTQPAVFNATLASQSSIRCNNGNDGSVSVTTTGGTSPYQFSIDGGAFQSSGNFTGLIAGSHNVVARDANLCSVTIPVTLTEPAILAITETHADVICPDAEEGSIALTITGGTGPYSVLWGDDNTATSVNRVNITDGDYRAVVTDINGCYQAIDVTVGVIGSEDCLAIPEIITPNGDGYNDVWRIKNIDMFPNAEVIVFNRWGKRVFQAKNLLDNPWDGTIKGDLLPTDSYHYILDLHNGTKPKSGVISIIK